MVFLRNQKRHTALFALSALILGVTFTNPALANESQPGTPLTTQELLKNFANRASEIGINALSLLGIRYKRGGNSPESGLDCSGFVNYVFKETFGASLPRTALGLSRVGLHVKRDDLQPGDLVFYNTMRRAYSHVGIYLGDGKFIHSPATGGFVRIDSMDDSYWRKRFDGARRLEDTDDLEPAI